MFGDPCFIGFKMSLVGGATRYATAQAELHCPFEVLDSEENCWSSLGPGA